MWLLWLIRTRRLVKNTEDGCDGDTLLSRRRLSPPPLPAGHGSPSPTTPPCTGWASSAIRDGEAAARTSSPRLPDAPATARPIIRNRAETKASAPDSFLPPAPLGPASPLAHDDGPPSDASSVSGSASLLGCSSASACSRYGDTQRVLSIPIPTTPPAPAPVPMCSSRCSSSPSRCNRSSTSTSNFFRDILDSTAAATAVRPVMDEALEPLDAAVNSSSLSPSAMMWVEASFTPPCTLSRMLFLLALPLFAPTWCFSTFREEAAGPMVIALGRRALCCLSTSSALGKDADADGAGDPFASEDAPLTPEADAAGAASAFAAAAAASALLNLFRSGGPSPSPRSAQTSWSGASAVR